MWKNNFKTKALKHCMLVQTENYAMKFYDVDAVFTFGKYEGKSLAEVYVKDPKYLTFCSENIDEFYVSPEVMKELKSAKFKVEESDFEDFEDQDELFDEEEIEEMDEVDIKEEDFDWDEDFDLADDDFDDDFDDDDF